MKCYYHPDREIVAVCTECGKGLCGECASQRNPVLCRDCAAERLQERRRALKLFILLGAVIFAMGVICGIVSAI